MVAAPQPDGGRNNRPIRVLVLSLYYSPEITANAPIVTELARMLAADGFEVQVVAGTPHYRLPEVPARYRRRLYVRKVLDGVAVTRCYAYPKSDGVLPKLLNYSSFLLTATPACLLAPRADVVLVVSPPFLLGFVGALVRWFRGSRLVYNAQDLFPEGYAGASVAPSRTSSTTPLRVASTRSSSLRESFPMTTARKALALFSVARNSRVNK